MSSILCCRELVKRQHSLASGSSKFGVSFVSCTLAGMHSMHSMPDLSAVDLYRFPACKLRVQRSTAGTAGRAGTAGPTSRAATAQPAAACSAQGVATDSSGLCAARWLESSSTLQHHLQVMVQHKRSMLPRGKGLNIHCTRWRLACCRTCAATRARGLEQPRLGCRAAGRRAAEGRLPRLLCQ